MKTVVLIFHDLIIDVISTSSKIIFNIQFHTNEFHTVQFDIDYLIYIYLSDNLLSSCWISIEEINVDAI